MRFKDIAFHRNIQQNLIANVIQNKVAHAQLFWGPSGNGKMALALAYAQFLLCKDRYVDKEHLIGDSCGICSACQKVQTLSHPDVHVVFPVQAGDDGSSITSFDYMAEFRAFVNEYRAMIDLYSWLNYSSKAKNEEKKKLGIINAKTIDTLLEHLQITPAEAPYKIILIWLPENTQYQAAPKLLKTLEEPTLNTIFLLVSEDKDSLLSTILSRLQQWYIPPLTTNEIYAFLKHHYPTYADEQISNAAYFGRTNGSKAVEYLLQGEKWNFMLDFFKNWMRAIFKFNPLQLHELAKTFAGLSRDQQKQLLRECAQFVSDSFHLRHNIRQAEALMHPEKDFFQKFSAFVDIQFFQTFVKETDIAIQDIERSGNPRLIFWTFSFQLVKIASSLNPK